MSDFIFDEESFKNPNLPAGLHVIDVEVEIASDESLDGYGMIIDDLNEWITDSSKFQIVKWPVQGRRRLDPCTGDGAGTTEGNFCVRWQGDYYLAENLAIAATSNKYLDGPGAPPEIASYDGTTRSDGTQILLCYVGVSVPC